MAGTTHCFIPVRGKRLRVTTLDECGRPPAGGTEDAYVATDGFISVALTSETEDGTEIITKKASGALCVNEKAADSFKRFTIEIEFCGVNPALMAIVSNAEPYADYAGDIAGFTVAEGDVDKKFALELWTGLSGQACAAGAEEASGYLLLPYVNAGVLGDFTVDGENAVSFTVSGAYTKGGNAWGTGPYDVVLDDTSAPAVLPSALDPLDHLLLMDTGLAPPPDACDAQPMPDTAGAGPATGATAGTPGTWTPAGSTPPASVATIGSVVASPNTAWTTGEYVQTGTSGGAGQAYWDGAAWTAGQAP